MYETLIKELRRKPTHASNDARLMWDASDAIEKLEQENAFLKTMQKQLASGIPSEDLGRMVARGLRGTRR